MTAVGDKLARIREAYERDQREARMAVAPSDIPYRFEAITTEWMTHILCKGHPEAKVVSVLLGEADSGTSNRRRIYVSYNEAGEAAGLPKSVFCKATVDLVNRILLSTSGVESETTFYKHIRPLVEIEAPVAYLATYDPESYASMIMLADLAGRAAFCTYQTPMPLNRVRDQLQLLAKLHGRFYQAEELKTTLAGMFRFDQRFARLDRDHDFKTCCEAGLLAASEVVPERLLKREKEVWPATLLSAARHGELPRTVTHGDVHLKNWYVTNEGRMGLGDWQVTSTGHWSRDVGYAITTALPVEDRRRSEQELLRFYLDEFAKAGGARVAFDEAWLNYRQQMLTTLAWWTMTLTPSKSMPDMQPLDITMEFIKRITHAIDDLDCLDSFN